MSRARIVIVGGAAILFFNCTHVRPSLWENNGAYTVCSCDGNERQPTPSEAAAFKEGERVDMFCEGVVRDCRPGSLRGPIPRHYNVPFVVNGLD